MPPSKVLYIIGTLDRGGTETQLVQLVRRMNRRRFEPMVCCLSHGGPLMDTLIGDGIPVKVIGFRGFRIFRHPHKVAFQLCRLVRFVWKAKPVLVHGFLFWAYVLGAFAARLAGTPVVVASRRSLGLFKADMPHYLFLERTATRMTDLLVANSEAVKMDVMSQEYVEPSKIRVIYNGIDPTLFQGAASPALKVELGIPEGSKIVGVVANLIHYKGHHYFLHACQRVKEKRPRTKFLLVGEGPCRKELEGLARDLGLEGDVLFLGTRADVPRLLAIMDVVVLPSLQEGFPNAILEAMAASKPVVATRVGGVPEAVIDGETGLLVPSKDPQALATAVLALLDDAARARAFGQAARDRVVRAFGLDRMVRETEDLYEELIARRGKEGG